MLKITKVVGHSTTNMSGCSKNTEYSCGIQYKMG